jgi:hypothetical protein
MKVKQGVVVKPKSEILLTHFLLVFYWFPIANNKTEGIERDGVFFTPSEAPRTPTQRLATLSVNDL